MQSIVIRIGRVGDPPLFPEVEKLVESDLSKVSILESGMSSGAASVAFMAKLPDGSYAIMQLSAGMLHHINAALCGAEERFRKVPNPNLNLGRN